MGRKGLWQRRTKRECCTSGLGVDEDEMKKRVRGGRQIHRLTSRAKKRSLCPQSTFKSLEETP